MGSFGPRLRAAGFGGLGVRGLEGLGFRVAASLGAKGSSCLAVSSSEVRIRTSASGMDW